MALPHECCSAPTTQTVNVPGIEGEAGNDGANAFTVATASFNVPAAAGSNVTVDVENSEWMVVGQVLVFAGPATFRVVSKPSTTSVILTWLDYPNDIAGGTLINSGAAVSPSGEMPAVPIPIASGGTGAASKADAQVALGLGQTPTGVNGAAIAYDITNSVATITGMTIVVPQTGLYLVLAMLSVDFRGVTFASSRILTAKVRNTTDGADVISTERTTGAPTTTDYPSQDFVIPFSTATLTAGKTLALQCGLNTVESAGSSVVNIASLMIVPLAIS